MRAWNNGLQNINSINVGSVEWNDANFNQEAFCDGFPAGNGETIYADSYEVAVSWKKGGIANWDISYS